MAKDYYKILGVHPDSSADEIKEAYRRLAHKYHPDKGGDGLKFKEVQQSYEALFDTSKRREYDSIYKNQYETRSRNDQTSRTEYSNPTTNSRTPNSQTSPHLKRMGKIFLVIIAIAIGYGVVYNVIAGSNNNKPVVQNIATPNNNLDAIKNNLTTIPTNSSPADEDKDLTNKVGQLISLPTNETPTIATVSDLNKLKGQPFIGKAQLGDKVLIYTKASKAILYRPSENKIIEIAPLTTDSVPPSNNIPQPVTPYSEGWIGLDNGINGWAFDDNKPYTIALTFKSISDPNYTFIAVSNSEILNINAQAGSFYWTKNYEASTVLTEKGVKVTNDVRGFQFALEGYGSTDAKVPKGYYNLIKASYNGKSIQLPSNNLTKTYMECGPNFNNISQCPGYEYLQK